MIRFLNLGVVLIFTFDFTVIKTKYFSVSSILNSNAKAFWSIEMFLFIVYFIPVSAPSLLPVGRQVWRGMGESKQKIPTFRLGFLYK